jgi:phosphoserine phosphatase RsbU/P
MLSHPFQGRAPEPACYYGPNRCWKSRTRRSHQLVGNLVSNAITYGTPEAPVRVISKVEENAFAISVHNQGPAIAVDVLPHISQPMSRGSEAGRASRSVGLGLYIVREIARAHGGQTSVTSVAAEGTTFTTVIPRTPARP